MQSNKGNSNSGRERSGEINTPHSLGEGIWKLLFNSIFLGQEYSLSL